MQVVYLIGNGFDLNLGMKTSYLDFYNYYGRAKTTNDVIRNMKKSINNSVKKKLSNDKDINWSDLELALGQYCRAFQDKQEFDLAYRDIVTHLSKYLQKEEKQYDIPLTAQTIMCKDLCNPLKYLTEVDKEEVADYFKALQGECHINIITYNYTNSVEKILNWKNSTTHIGSTINNRTTYLDNIWHIHGYTNNRMVLGVNDETQVDNENLLKNKYFKNAIIKKECNRAQKTTHVKSCQNIINNANLICMFGLSIGETDKDWWNIVANSIIKNNSKLLIFTYSKKDINGIFSFDREEIEDDKINSFVDKTSLSDENKEKVKKNIYIAINTNIFGIKFTSKKINEALNYHASVKEINDIINKVHSNAKSAS